MSRVVRFDACGGPEVLRIADETVRPPAAGEIQIRIEAIGLNRAEAAFRAGHYLEQPEFPARLGYEAAGVVAALGPGVAGFAIGDPVCVIPGFSMSRHGVYAELANVPATAVLARPAGLTAEAAAALWMAALTAYGGLIEAGGLCRGERVLITAPSSSVGLAAIQVARRLGATPIALTTSPAKREALLAAGAELVLVAGDGEAPAAALERLSGRAGVELVFDPIAGPGVEVLAAALAPQGRLVLYGNLSGAADATPFPFRLAVGRGLSLRGYLVFETIADRDCLRGAEAFIRDALAAGTLQPTIARRFAFTDIVAAHRYLESNQQVGKVVVSVGDRQSVS